MLLRVFIYTSELSSRGQRFLGTYEGWLALFPLEGGADFPTPTTQPNGPPLLGGGVNVARYGGRASPGNDSLKLVKDQPPTA